jgi:hypothetical protein
MIKRDSKWIENGSGRLFIVLMDEDADGVCASMVDCFAEEADFWFSPTAEFLQCFKPFIEVPKPEFKIPETLPPDPGPAVQVAYGTMADEPLINSFSWRQKFLNLFVWIRALSGF